MEYSYARTESNKIGENRDCAVIAATIATGFPYNVVHAFFSKNGRSNNCGTPFMVTENSMNDLGFLLVWDDSFESKTLKQIESELPIDKTYLITVRGHLVCAKFGKIQDWSAGSKRRIRNIHRVVNCNGANK